MRNPMFVTHTFEPIYNKESKILILGTFPSVKSREGEFYYHHPQNRFWKVIAGITNCPEPQSIAEKKILLLHHGIAIWDVIKSCEIEGSSDSSIRNVVSNDLNRVLQYNSIDKIYANGNKAYQLYNRYCKDIHKEIEKLPSTSPANAAYSLDRLILCWRESIDMDLLSNKGKCGIMIPTTDMRRCRREGIIAP